MRKRILFGMFALAIWDLPHEAEIIQPWGTSRVRAVLREGRWLRS